MNALTMFDNKNVAVPAHVRGFLETESNIDDKVTVPTLSFEGKVWQISLDGEKTKLMKRDAETGDETPVGVLRVVILDYAKRRGRAYYEGAYDPAKPGTPLCWSEDGVAPDPTVADKQSSKCDTCPMSAKGSKVTDNGKAVVACSQHRMLAVVPSNNLDFEPLRMKIAITSDWDKQSPELEKEGWYAFNNYTDFLRSKGVQHTAALVTKMRFDSNVAYPKLMFSPDRWLTEEEIAKIAPVTKSDGVKDLIAGKYTPDGAAGVEKGSPEKEPDAQPPQDEVEEEVIVATKPKTAAKPKAEKPKPAVVEDDDEDVAFPTTKASEAVIEATAVEKPVSTAVPEDLSALLEDWGDD